MGTGNLSVEKLAGMPEQRLVLQSECCLQHVETIPSGESLCTLLAGARNQKMRTGGTYAHPRVPEG